MILESHQLVVFGWNKSGRLGLGPSEGKEFVEEPALVPSFCNEKIVDIGAGMSFSVALTASGSVYTWGSGLDGALGVGDEKDR